MKIRRMFALALLCSAALFAQSQPNSQDAAKAAEKPHGAACKRDMSCCKGKGDKSAKKDQAAMGECCKNGKCAHMKHDEKKS